MEPTVGFEEAQYARKQPLKYKNGLDFTGLVMKLGLASTVEGAQKILIVIAVLLIGFAGWFYYENTPHMPSSTEARIQHPELNITRDATP